MSFKTILRRTYRPDESLYLMKLGYTDEEDELGFGEEKYIIQQELHGIIQKPQELIENCDKCLYKAKENGRNQVVNFEE